MLAFIGGAEIFFILLAILLLFGSKKIPEVARAMGKGLREFQKATDDIKKEFSENTNIDIDEKDEKKSNENKQKE